MRRAAHREPLSTDQLFRAAIGYARTPDPARAIACAASAILPDQPERNAEILRLRNDAGLSWGEIGERLGVSRNTVAGVVWRAVKRHGWVDRLALGPRP
jgi:DNA-directed RNA polymerase specialized sigma24 family protein